VAQAEMSAATLSSANAKQLAQLDFQSNPGRCKSGGGYKSIYDFRFTIYERKADQPCVNRKSEIVNSLGSQSVISSARRFAKAEARGANPRESATLKDEG